MSDKLNDIPIHSSNIRINSASPGFFTRLGLVIVAGCVQSLCFPPVGLSFLFPFTIAAFLFLIHGQSIKQAFRLGFVFGLVWFLGDLFWLSNIFGLASVSLCAILAFFIGLFAGLYVWIIRRFALIPLWILAPLIWTGIEYFRSELFILNFGWLGLGYGVVNSPLLAICASTFGCYGLTFFIVGLGAGLASFRLESRRNSKMIGGGILVCWLILILVPMQSPVPANPLHVRLIQANSEDTDSLFSLSMPTSGSPVDIIVWPEYSLLSDPTRETKLWDKLAPVAQNNHAYFLFGAKEQFDPANEAGYRNTAYLLDPNGKLIGKHYKNHTVHFFRDGIAGKSAKAISTSIGKLGVGICFDMDYPDVARRLAEDGAEVLLIPNDDPPEWGPIQQAQHRLMFQMRAAECGRWLARADVAGGTSVASPIGKETARAKTSQPAKLDVVVGRENGKTIFVRGGWRFGQLCFLALITLWTWGLISSWRENRQKRIQPSENPARGERM